MRDITDISDVKKRYRAYLMLEKGMSANTAVAYSDDVDKLGHSTSVPGSHHQWREELLQVPETGGFYGYRPN